MKMTKLLLLVLGTVLSLGAGAAESTYPLEDMSPDLRDQASLQRGLQTYMNYCHACHALGYQRYLRTAEDFGIPEDLMLEHIMFDPDARIGDHMNNAMSAENGKAWFGAAPPDLTLYTQLKGGPDYLYTYLKTFYIDESRPLGVNNLVFENVGMPHVLIDLQGVQQKVCKQIPMIADNGGEMRDPLTGEYVTEEKCGEELVERGYSPLELVEGTGSMTPEEYDQLAYDLTNFLYYMSEPVRLERERIGIYVLLFLAFFFVPAYLLGREYHS